MEQRLALIKLPPPPHRTEEKVEDQTPLRRTTDGSKNAGALVLVTKLHKVQRLIHIQRSLSEKGPEKVNVLII